MEARASIMLAQVATLGIEVVGPDDPQLLLLTKNVTAIEMPLAGVVWPKSTEDTVAVVRLARQFNVPLYPVSTGLNWGYGSRSPVMPGCVLLDMGRMKRIRNEDQISPLNPVALVEPGVTQQQLYAYLKSRHPDLTFNVTGAGRDTSLLGNALDRGVGYLGPRRDDIYALEVVTGTGEVIYTGFRRLGEDSPLAHTHPYGLGPMLDGLFFQGNFGIVTSACFRLQPRRPLDVAVSLGLKDSKNLAAFIDMLAELKREGVLSSVTHIGNRARTQSTLMHSAVDYLTTRCGVPAPEAGHEAARCLSLVTPTEWAGLASVSGSHLEVFARLLEIRNRIKRLARVKVVSGGLLKTAYGILDRLRWMRWARAQAAAITGVLPLHGLALGRPTDVPLNNLLYKYNALDHLKPSELDQSDCGLLFINPALPLSGSHVAVVVEMIEQVTEDAGFIPYVTLNIETCTSLVGVINILFNRRDTDEVRRAHKCADDILSHLKGIGLMPYRARADMMGNIVDADSTYWQTVYGLKQTLDPDDIISPGRYNLTFRDH